MAHPTESRTAVRGAYLGGLTLEIAATQHGIPVSTARRWMAEARKNGDDWDRLRSANLVVAGGGIEQAIGRVIAAGLARCEALIEHINLDEKFDAAEAVKAMAVLGDTVAKLKAAGKGMMPAANQLAVAQDVLQGFAEYLMKRDHTLAAALIEHIEPYGQEVATRYG